MAHTDDRMLAKVRKLLALAEDPAATPEEAESYTARATTLIAEYGIDRALLAHADPGRDPVGDLVLGVEAPYAMDKADLLAAVAAALRCQAVRRTRRDPGRRQVSMHLFGHDSDLARTEVLYTSLLVQAATGLGRTVVPRGEHVAAFRRSWLAGFRRAVAGRLHEAEAGARSDAEERFARAGTSGSLVLADRSARVEEAMMASYPHLRTGRPRRLSGGGLADGWRAGQQADLGGVRVGPSARGRLA